jgi:hypothetical protein
MNQFPASSLVIILVPMIHLHAAEPTGAVEKVTIVRTVAQHPGAARIWEPYVARINAKQLVVAYGVGVAGKADMGDIACCISTDDGKTWGEAVTIFDHRQRHGLLQFGYANPVLYRAPGQDLVWCFAMRCPMAWQHSEDSQLVGAYSGDGGRSWNAVELTMHYSGPLIIVGGIYRLMIDGQPRYLLPAHRNTLRNDPRGSRDQFILESKTLLEWRLPGNPKDKIAQNGFVPQPKSGPIFLHEGQLAVGDSEDEIKMVMRVSQYEKEGEPLPDPKAHSSISKDHGKTWSMAAPEPDLPNFVSKAFFGKDQKGNHIYVYSDQRSRMALKFKVRAPGKAWSEERVFFDAGTKNSYPTLVENGPGEWDCVWDSGTDKKDRTMIRYGKLIVK